jgi:hypothetical protein
LHAIFATAVDDDLIRRNPCRIKGAGFEHSHERPTATLTRSSPSPRPSSCGIGSGLLATLLRAGGRSRSAPQQRDLDTMELGARPRPDGGGTVVDADRKSRWHRQPPDSSTARHRMATAASAVGPNGFGCSSDPGPITSPQLQPHLGRRSGRQAFPGSGSPSTTCDIPAPGRKGAELHLMHHFVDGVGTLLLGLVCGRVPRRFAGWGSDTPWLLGCGLRVALDDRMWRPNRLGWVIG